MDALMAAICGEPVAAGGGAEAERQAAEADVALLREQLGVIGRALAEPAAPEHAPAPESAPEPESAPAPAPESAPAPAPTPAPEPESAPAPARAAPVRVLRPRRRRLTMVFGVLAVACAGVFVAGLGWLAAQGGGAGVADDAAGSKAEASAGQDAGSLFGSAGYLACARVVAEGTVTAAEPVPGEARHRITLDVTRSHKPARSAPELTFVLDDSTARLRPGDHALVGILPPGTVADAVVTGARAVAAERPRIAAALPESRTLTCD